MRELILQDDPPPGPPPETKTLMICYCCFEENWTVCNVNFGIMILIFVVSTAIAVLFLQTKRKLKKQVYEIDGISRKLMIGIIMVW